MRYSSPHRTTTTPDHLTYPPHRVLSIVLYIHREYALKPAVEEDQVSAHPARCRGCRGSGYTDGPPITERVAGQPHTYTTVQPCTHRWYDDDPGHDPYYDEPRPNA